MLLHLGHGFCEFREEPVAGNKAVEVPCGGGDFKRLFSE